MMVQPHSNPAYMNETKRRAGDTIQIPGDYQARALDSKRASQRFWHQAKLRLIDRVAPPKTNARIADVGCGSGTIASHLAKRAKRVIGVDSNPEAINFATSAFGTNNLTFVLGQFQALLDFAPFDQIYCIEVIGHLYREQILETLILFRRVANPGCQLFMTTPNYNSAWPLIEWGLDKFGLVPKLAGDQHVTYLTRTRLARLCAEAGWRVKEIGSFNGLAPFIAHLSYPLALKAEQIELRLRKLLPLNLIYCVCERTE